MAIKDLGGGRYQIRIDKKNYSTGARKTKTLTLETELTGRQLDALLFTKEAELEREVDKELNEVSNPGDLNLKDYFEKIFIKNKKREQNTIDWYVRYLRNRTYTFFGNKKIKTISDLDVKNFFSMLDNAKKANGKPLSQKTKKHYLTVLKAIFEDCVERDVMDKNPASKIQVNVPNRPLSVSKFYTPDELKESLEKLSEYATTDKLTYFVLSYVCGFRPAEIMGLVWNKVSFERKEILVDKSLAATTKGYIYKSTKNENVRTSILTNYALSLLKAHKNNEKMKYAELKLKIPFEENYVFTLDNGSHWGKGKFRDFWSKFCKKHGLRYIPPYGLRHTSATLLAYANVPLPSIAKHLGDYSIESAQKYIHAVEDNRDIYESAFDLPNRVKVKKKDNVISF